MDPLLPFLSLSFKCTNCKRRMLLKYTVYTNACCCIHSLHFPPSKALSVRRLTDVYLRAQCMLKRCFHSEAPKLVAGFRPEIMLLFIILLGVRDLCSLKSLLSLNSSMWTLIFIRWKLLQHCPSAKSSFDQHFTTMKRLISRSLWPVTAFEKSATFRAIR